MEEVDLLVLGGGINGAGIARDAAGRGLRVLLCEQHDLAAHTSSASSKLIHGGLRYLEQGTAPGPSVALRAALGTAPAPALDAARGAVAVRPPGPAQPCLPRLAGAGPAAGFARRLALPDAAAGLQLCRCTGR
ncbi:hypothetical protein G6F24_014249 [Rhizopus arrhizus]|nr:hypothetical protein G6F24_014249 [Rhizopus arrhizus]